MKTIEIEKRKNKLVIILITVGILSATILGITLTQTIPFSGVIGQPSAPVIDPITPNPNIDGTVIIRWSTTVQFSMSNIYELYRSRDGEVWTLVGDDTPWGTAYKDENLVNGVYTYKVRAREAGVFSIFSSVVSVSVEQYVYIPVNPIALILPLIVPNPNTDGNVKIKLTNGVPNAIGYDLYRSSDDISYTLLYSINTQITTIWTYHDSDVEDGKTYYYKVEDE